MDANKLVKLKVIGYQVRQTCGNCIHSGVISPNGWGTCKLHTYDHQKHTGPARQLSISRSGWCTSWTNPDFKAQLEGFGQLAEEKP